jgi:DNA mismatch endonuclease (patch repair protein)
MADTFTPQARSLLMARVKQTGTQPERVVRALLRRLRLRYVSHVRRLPGRPDLVLRDFRIAIFVHGCFWHNHSGCRRGSLPSSNREFWLRKIASNVRRDRAAVRALRADNWSVAIIWQCQTSDDQRLAVRIHRLTRRADKSSRSDR